MVLDPELQVLFRAEELVREAQQERLAAQLPHTQSRVRRELAVACYRLASWLDDNDGHDGSDEYLPPVGSGPSDWLPGSANV